MDKLYGLIQDINPKEICNHIENGNLAEWCNAWIIAAKEALQPKTNADRIRAMNDEALSVFLWCFEREELARESDCMLTRRQILKWLQSHAEKEGE